MIELEAAAAAGKADADASAEHDLVKAVRDELDSANARGTVAGQLALQMARRIANPEATGISTMSKELRSLLAEAKGAVAQPDGPTDPAPVLEPEDEVTKARRVRDEQRAAAGLG